MMMFAYNGEAVAQASKLGKAAKEVVKKAKKSKSSGGTSTTRVKPKVKIKTKESKCRVAYMLFYIIW